LSLRSVRALRVSGREDIRRLKKKKRYGRAFSLGMTLIDTSGDYGEGRSEELIKRVIAGQRDRAFVVSKVEANDVARGAMVRACEASLSRLGTDYLDLYLLHWPVSNAHFPEMVAGFERLRAASKIRSWGVSNFSIRQMEDLFRIPQGNRCATNQVPYSIGNRAIERDLLPWCEQHGMPVMAYSRSAAPAPGCCVIARGCSAAAVALAWTIRSGGVIAIPESGSPAHTKENAVALALTLTPQELQTCGCSAPAPLISFINVGLLTQQALQLWAKLPIPMRRSD